MSNLRLINETTITSGVSTVNIEDVFSAEYDVYKLVMSGMTTVGTLQTSPNFRFINSGGSVISASNYDYAHEIYRADTTTPTEQSATNQAQLYRFPGESVDQVPDDQGQVSYIFNPFDSSKYSFAIYESIVTAASLTLSMKGIGVLKQKASMTGFQVIDSNASRPFAGGQIKTYGLRVDS